MVEAFLGAFVAAFIVKAAEKSGQEMAEGAIEAFHRIVDILRTRFRARAEARDALNRVLARSSRPGDQEALEGFVDEDAAQDTRFKDELEGFVPIIRANSGIRLAVEDWVPALDPTYGWWGASRQGEVPDARVNWTRSGDAVLLPPGAYDVYWCQDGQHVPMLLATAVELDPGFLAMIRADSGIRLAVDGWVPALDPDLWLVGCEPAGRGP